MMDGAKSLPDGWCWVRLGELCDRIDYGFTASADNSISEPQFLRITDIQGGVVDWKAVPGCRITSDEETANRLADGDIVFARTGATTGKSLLIRKPPRAVFASYLIRLRAKSIVLPEFMYAFFQSGDYWNQIRSTARGGAQPNVNATLLSSIVLPLPPLDEQNRITAIVNQQMAAVERARAAAEAQLEAVRALPPAYIRESLAKGPLQRMPLSRCLIEVCNGIGNEWTLYRLVGATRAGIAPAKEKVGKKPGRYKLVDQGTIFYNPMRILLGSIAFIDEWDSPGITSPDYVVFKTRTGLLHPRWFYYWLRSPKGEAFIKTLTRGAVRERMLFRRLAQAETDLPAWEAQLEAAEKMQTNRFLAGQAAEQLDAINRLPAALLRRAFGGGL